MRSQFQFCFKEGLRAKSLNMCIAAALLFLSVACSPPSDDTTSNDPIAVAPSIQCPTSVDSIITISSGTILNLTEQLGIDESNSQIIAAPTQGMLEYVADEYLYTHSPGEVGIDSLTIASNIDCGQLEFTTLLIPSGSTVDTTPVRYDDGGIFEAALLPVEISHCMPEFMIQQPPYNGLASIDSQTGQLNYSVDLDAPDSDTFSYLFTCGNLSSEPVWINTRPNTVELTVPAYIAAPVGKTTRLYYNNLVNFDTIDDLSFEIAIEGRLLGSAQSKYWEFTPLTADVGQRELTVKVFNQDGSLEASSRSYLKIYDPSTLSTSAESILFIGDSLTANGYLVSFVEAMLDTAGFHALNYKGSVEAQGVNFEAYGGASWALYYQQLSPKNPFFYADTGLDIDRYFAENLQGEAPAYIYIMLGVNDIFTRRDKNYATIQASIDTIFETAESFISALRTSAPETKIIIGSIVPPNIRPESFIDDYGEDIRQRYKNVQHSFVKRQEAQFSGREAENLYFLPLWHHLDTLNGYPEHNALHPNPAGYEQMAISIFHEFLLISGQHSN